MADPQSDFGYVRRLDRTIENDRSNLARVTEEDRQKIYSLRNVFGEKIHQIQNLEESIAEKDLAIERERELRRNLEEKLFETNLVDMYGDPAVNEELHERLPRAARERQFSLHGSPNSKKSRRKGKVKMDDSDGEIYDENGKHNLSYPGAMFYPYPPFPNFHPGIYPGNGFQVASQSTPLAGQSSNQSLPPFGFPFIYSPSPNTPLKSEQTEKETKNEHINKDNVNIIKAASLLSADSKERQIALLLQEIDLLKDQNRKLSEKYTEQISLCNELRLEKELRDTTSQEQIASKVSVLIQEIYAKQKQRDDAVMGRLHLANEERDRALMILNTLKDNHNLSSIVSGGEEDGENAMKILSSLDMDADMSDVINSIHSSTNQMREANLLQMKRITEERDKAELKVQKFESELLHTQRRLEEFLPLQDELTKLKKQFANTQQERDMALTKLRSLEEDNSNLQLYYGLHKSLSKEQSLRDLYNNSLGEMQKIIEQRDGHVIDAQKETNKLQAIIQELSEQKDCLMQDLDKVKASEEDQRKINEKLERHVNVLQKKLKRLSVEQGKI